MPGKTLWRFLLFIKALISAEFMSRSPFVAESVVADSVLDGDDEPDLFLFRRGMATPAAIPPSMQSRRMEPTIQAHFFLPEC
jgi:hypothetical protein